MYGAHLAAFSAHCRALHRRRCVFQLWYARLRWFFCALCALAFLGWVLFASHTAVQPVAVWGARLFSVPAFSVSSAPAGRGSGNSASTTQDDCGLVDFACHFSNTITTETSVGMQGLRDATNGVFDDPANIMLATPAADSYDNTIVKNLNTLFLEIVDAALGVLLLLGGYNVIFGHHLQMQHTAVTELFPRAILVVCACHFNLTFLGAFIELNNVLCSDVVALASTNMLSSIVSGLLKQNPLSGLILIVFILTGGMMFVALIVQMAVRIAEVAVLCSLAPLGIGCFMLPQTARWGQLWLTIFATVVLVQFLQVTTLALGGMLLTDIGNTNMLNFDHELMTAVLTIAILWLALKIPTMLQSWALNPIREASQHMSAEGGGFGSSSGGSSSGSPPGGQAGESPMGSGGGEVGGMGSSQAMGSGAEEAAMSPEAAAVLL